MDKTDYSWAIKAKYLNDGQNSLMNNIKILKNKNKAQLDKKQKEFYKQYSKGSNRENNYITTQYEILTKIGGLSTRNLEDTKQRKTSSSTYSKRKFGNNSNKINTTNNFNSGIQITSQNLNTITNANFFPNMSTRENFMTPKNNTFQSTNNEHFLTTSSNQKNNFMKTNYTNTSNNSTMKNIKTFPKLTEEDTLNLISLYHISKHNKVENSLKKSINKDEKVFLFDKYGINIQTEDVDSEEIEKIIKSKGTRKDQFQKTMDRFNKTEYNSTPYFYSDPFKSYKKLKMNGEIFKAMMNHRASEQIEIYKNIYREEFVTQMKISQMPLVREAKSNKISDQNNAMNINLNLNIKENKKKILETLDTEKIIRKPKEIIMINDTAINFVNAKLSREQLLETIELNITYEEFRTKPNSRCQFTLTLVEDDLIMFGGLNSERLYDIWFCNLNDNNKWTSLEISEDDAPVPRSGHTAVLYKKEIFFYGGSTPREYFKSREEILVFSIHNRKFYFEKSYNRLDSIWRRNHIAVRVGNYMIVNGGIDESEKFLSDTSILDLNKMTWSKMESKNERPVSIAYHCAEMVMLPDKMNHPGFNLYKPPEIPLNKNLVKKIKLEGLYIFGGIDENRNYVNDLKIIRVTRRPCEWVYPKTHGIPPIGRSNATMNYYSDLNLLIIHGGRNETERRDTLNDIFFLDLENLNWIRCYFQQNSPYERTEHSAIVYGDKLLILGGNNGSSFCKFEFCIVHLDLQNRRQNRVKIPSIKSDRTQMPQLQIPPIMTFDNNNHLSPNKIPSTTRTNVKDKFFLKKIGHTLSNNGPIDNFSVNKDIVPFLETNKLNDIIKLIQDSKVGKMLDEEDD